MQQPVPEWTAATSPDGRPYWFNNVTKTSSWEKPAALLSPLERADLSTPWREHKGPAPEHKPYYFNTVTQQSSWTLPEELRVAREAAVRAAAVLASAPPPPLAMPMPLPLGMPPPLLPVPVHAPVVLRAPLPPQPQPHPFRSDAEAAETFKSALSEVGVASDWTWERAMQAVVLHRGYGALPTLARKKAAFTEFVAAKGAAEREAKKVKEAGARSALEAALSAALVKGDIGPDARPRDAERVIAAASGEAGEAGAGGNAGAAASAVPAWAWMDPPQLVTAVAHALSAVLAADAAKRAAEAAAGAGAAKAALSASRLGAASSWRDAAAVLDAAASAYAGPPPWRVLSPSQLVDAFAEWRRDIERSHAEAAARAAASERASQRAARADFSALLRAEAEAGRVTARSKWREFAVRVANHPAYIAVCSNNAGSTPRELFSDLVDALGDAASEDGAVVAAALGGGEEAQSRLATTPPADVLAQLKAAGGRAASLSAQQVEAICGEARATAEARAAKAARKAKRAASDFAALLRRKAPVAGAAWAAVRPSVAGDAAFAAVAGGEPEREALFAAHAAALLATGAQPGETLVPAGGGGSRRERGGDKRERKEKKRRRRRSSSSSSSEGEARHKRRRSVTPPEEGELV